MNTRFDLVLSALAITIGACDQAGEQEKLIAAFQNARVTTTIVGESAPDFRLRSVDFSGTDGIFTGPGVRTLNDFRGKYLVLHFWASWCPACQDEIPEIIALSSRYDTTQVAVVPVLHRDSEGMTRRWLCGENLQFSTPVLVDRNGRAGDSYGIVGVPQTVIIDPEGRIVETFFGRFMPLEETIDELLESGSNRTPSSVK
jgi:thiol-disulfide isomerase/thioredoxin